MFGHHTSVNTHVSFCCLTFSEASSLDTKDSFDGQQIDSSPSSGSIDTVSGLSDFEPSCGDHGHRNSFNVSEHLEDLDSFNVSGTQADLYNVVPQRKRQYKCRVCWKTFPQRHMLTSHVMRKPFMCSVCHKVFPRQTMVEVHMKSHQGMKYLIRKKSSKSNSYDRFPLYDPSERSHACGVCLKTFASASNLYSHSKSHF